MNTSIRYFWFCGNCRNAFYVDCQIEFIFSQTSYTSDNELKLIQNTKTLAEIIDYDFRKIGYKYTGNCNYDRRFK